MFPSENEEPLMNTKRMACIHAALVLAIGLAMASGARCAFASGIGEGSDLEIGGPGKGNGKMLWLRDLQFDSHDVLYALDSASDQNTHRVFTGNLLVQKFDAESGEFLGQISIGETKLGHQDQPSRITIDPHGNIYVAVPAAGVVQRFTAGGVATGDTAIPDASAVAFQPFGDEGRILVGTASRKNNQWLNVDTLETLTPDGAAGPALKLSRPITDIEDIRCDSAGNIYVLAGLHQIFTFSPDGTLRKIIGGGTELRLEDGSELYDSVAIDSHRNVYSMTWGNPSALARFDPDVTSVTMHKGQFHWADAWFGGTVVAIDQKDRVWVGAPGNTSGNAKYHYRPCIIRLKPDYLDATTNGVTTSSARILGLNLQATCKLPYNVSTTLAPTDVDFVVVAGNRQVHNMDVTWHAYDLWKNSVASGTFSL
jgi:hypothetical protein